MEENTENKNALSFLEHLEELRWHIIRSLGAVVALAIVAFMFRNIIFDVIILAPKNPSFFTNSLLASLAEKLNTPMLAINQRHLQIININMAGQFSTHMRVSMISGIMLAFPYIFYEIWRFIAPALHDNEKKHSRGAIFFTSFLFFLGVLFGYYLIVPLSVNFLGSYNVSEEVANQINLKSYIGSVTSISLAAGIVFELPVIIYFLSKVGLASPKGLRKYRRHAVIITLILSAVITPPDVFSQVLVCIPLVILYEVGIVISKRIEKKRLAKEAQEESEELQVKEE